MFWTLELASHLEDAPWPATKDELIDYSIRSGAPIEVIENLQELEDEGDLYEGAWVQPLPAVVAMAIEWAIAMPLLMRLAQRFDGVRPPIANGETARV